VGRVISAVKNIFTLRGVNAIVSHDAIVNSNHARVSSVNRAARAVEAGERGGTRVSSGAGRGKREMGAPLFWGSARIR
jgi:hypothetical protein